MSILIFESLPDPLLFTLPFIFAGFGFLKKLIKKAKNVVGGALTLIPGGSIIKTGIGVARKGLGAIVKEVRGKRPAPRPPETRFGTQESGAFSGFGGMNKNTLFILAGVAVVGFILLSARKR